MHALTLTARVYSAKQKEALKMVRMAPARISRLHVVELSGRLNPLGQNLDIVELASVYGK